VVRGHIPTSQISLKNGKSVKPLRNNFFRNFKMTKYRQEVA
jgi:hypothetical protein